MNKEKFDKKLTEVQKHMLTGISYMIPVIVASGTILGIASLAGQAFGFNPGDLELLETSSSEFVKCMVWLNKIAGGNFMNLMYPILAAFVAFSIGDRPALAPGLLGGMLAHNMKSGFLGALLIGFFAGYLITFMNKHIKIKRQYIGVKSMFIMPVFGCLAVAIVSRYVVGPIGQGFTYGCTWLVNTIGQAGNTALAAVLGGAVGFDFGGPVTRAASTISKQLYFDTNFTYVPNMLGGIIPPIGIGLATIIDKYVVGKRVFPPQLKTSGTPCMILGFLGISEGSLPFAISDPLGTIPVTVTGAAVGSAMAYNFGCHTFAGVPCGFYGYPLVTNLGGFFISLATGVMIVALGMIFRRNYLYKKEQRKMAVEQ
ncbi:PTS fructose EIIBC subunit family protein [Clostridium tertium]|uniref:Fructose-like permease IIC component 1 n=1 Tax=Clostridium tertium TaxID=1559 RepID=A0A6N3E623_9CLOT